MLKGNLATRPFYNERLVGLALALVAVVALGASIFNARELTTLTQQRVDLQAKISANERQTQDLTRQAAATQGTVDRKHLELLVAETHEANDLIDQRTFSWTSLLAEIERTLPIDVRLVAVSPKIEKGNTLITMLVVSRKADALSQFVTALEGSAGNGTFYDVIKHADQLNDDGTYDATIVAYYLPPTGSLASTAPGASGRGKGSVAPAAKTPGSRP